MVKFHTGKKLGASGDTIVEVLVAIAVVSVVLAGAFVSTRNSVNATRTAQEQGEALKLAESQVELIKSAVSTGTPNIVASTDSCIDTAGALQATCTTNNGIDYSATVTHIANSADFVVQVSWDSLSGGTNRVELDYRTQ